MAKTREKIVKLPVHCDHSALVDPHDLKTNPMNPNKHPREQIQIISRILKAHGWRIPITVSNRSGFIVRGAGRLQAAFELELIEVPVDYQNYESEEEEQADLLADTKASELSYLDEDLEKTLLEELNNEGFDLTLAGYDDESLQSILEIEDEEDNINPFGDGELAGSIGKPTLSIKGGKKKTKNIIVSFGEEFQFLIEEELFIKLKIQFERCFDEFQIPINEAFKAIVKQGVVLLGSKNDSNDFDSKEEDEEEEMIEIEEDEEDEEIEDE